jgi:RsiW-degrading membrane proteinase PrsW (M82 family)
VDLPFTITMADPNEPKVLAIIFAVFVPGVVWLWFQRQPSDSSRPLLDLDFVRWAGRREGGVAIVVGVVAGLSASLPLYFDSPTWGSSWADLTALVGGVFGAFVVAANAPSVLAQASNKPAVTEGAVRPAAGQDQ